MGFPQHLPEELAIDILSRLPVKSLMRFKCVSKSWKSLISDSRFVKLHLHRSISRSTDFAQNVNDLGRAYLSSRSITSLLKSHSQSRVWLSEYKIIGTCNGLICLSKEESDNLVGKNCSWIRFWNPATRLVSQSSPPLSKIGHCFGFGYDCSSDTYKVVAVKIIDVVVKVVKQVEVEQYNGVTLVNVYSIALADLVLHNHGQPMDTDPYVIVSFDLGKEEFTQLSLPYCPRLRDELSDFVPILGVLRGCLCISQNNRTTHNLTVWQMKEFGVHASWTRLFNIVGDENIFFSPCFASFISDESGDALLFPEPGVALAVLLYRKRAKKLERTNIPNHIIDCKVNSYIESLISPY